MKNKSRWFRVAAVVAILVTCVGGYLGWSGRLRPFSRLVTWPVPLSVRDIRSEGSDWLGFAPEPVVYLGFTATPEDLSEILKRKGFNPAPEQERKWFITRQGPAWWHAQSLSDGSKLYFLQGHRGQEYLRVDNSGTNALYLLWGI